MDAEGEIQRGRALAQDNQVAIGREDVDLLIEQIQLELVDEFQRTVLSASMTSWIWPIHWSSRLSARCPL